MESWFHYKGSSDQLRIKGRQSHDHVNRHRNTYRKPFLIKKKIEQSPQTNNGYLQKKSAAYFIVDAESFPNTWNKTCQHPPSPSLSQKLKPVTKATGRKKQDRWLKITHLEEMRETILHRVIRTLGSEMLLLTPSPQAAGMKYVPSALVQCFLLKAIVTRGPTEKNGFMVTSQGILNT